MTRLRILADDLTGALDTGAAFASLSETVEVAWKPAATPVFSGHRVWDTGTRELKPDAARARLTPFLPAFSNGDIAYKKLDSLMRGPWSAELAACLSAAPWAACILAPAFPAQGRRTRAGRQEALRDGVWSTVSGDIAEILASEGIAARHARPGEAPGFGVTVYDAETDADLARIAAAGRAVQGPVLWCGSGGLAAHLAEGGPAPHDRTLATPLLGLFGSDQPQTAAQLAACGRAHMRIEPGPGGVARVREALSDRALALVSLDIPAGLSREAAADRIAEDFGALVRNVPSPRTLLVAGGETLKAVCIALGTDHLIVTGQVAPGIPRSTMVRGRWDGLTVVSKSGAFGEASLWSDLLVENRLLLSPSFSIDRTDV